MKKIEKDFATEVLMSGDEAKNICRLGQREKCCAFLTCGAQGFTCSRMEYPISMQIMLRLDAGEMNAQGLGGWEGCAWEEELKTDPKTQAAL